MKEARIQDDISDFTVPVTIGAEESVGEEFKIIAVLANESAQEEFKNYLETAAVNHWPGMSNLPEGAEEYCIVKVTRK